ncbi:MAG: hypothetical protein IT425_01405 [Pirellulales bacterium]|nr:hypothetical protein [Pirellulales bacterium]
MVAVERWIGYVLVAVALSAAGCGSSGDGGSADSGPSMDEMVAQLEAENKAREEKAAAEAKAAADQQAAQAAQSPAEPEKKVAGREQMQPGGYLSAIAGARRHVLNQVESWAWKQGVQHFRATEGRKPKDHDEFMKKIVIPLEIDLGFKEEDQEFWYDPNAPSDGDLGVLYVVKKESATP